MKKIILTLTLFATLLLGCEKYSSNENALGKTPEYQAPQPFEKLAISPPTVKDGRLFFTDFNTLQAYMDKIVNKDIRAINELNTKAIVTATSKTNDNKGFISYTYLADYATKKEYQEANISINNKSSVVIEDSYLGSIINANKEIQIGEFIFRIEDEYLFIYRKGHFNEVSNFKTSGIEISPKDTLPTLVNSNLEVIKLSGEITTETGKNFNIWAGGYGWRVNTKPVNAGGNKRALYQQYQYNLYFYVSSGVKTAFQEKRGWWIFKSWKAYNAVYTQVWWTAQVAYRFPNAPRPSYMQVSDGIEKWHTDKAEYHFVRPLFQIGFNSGNTVKLGRITLPIPTGASIIGFKHKSLRSYHRFWPYGGSMSKGEWLYFPY